MSRPTSARPQVEVLEAREVPALGLDPTFGTGGIALDPVAGGRFISVIATAVLPTGETVIVGTADGESSYGFGDLEIARLTATGAADTRFGGGDGLVAVTLSSHPEYVSATVLPNGKILVAGTDTPAEGVPWNPFVIRLNADGTRDLTFGTGGRTDLDFGGVDTIARVAVQADGKIVLAGGTIPDSVPVYPYYPPEAQLVVQRLNANGTPDTAFGTGGRVVVTDDGSWATRGLAVQADGKIVVGGHVTPGYSDQMFGGTTELTVRRFGANGTPDASFGTAGRAATTYDSFTYAYANDMALLGDGRIVVGGSSSYGQGLLAWFGSNGAVISQEQFSGIDGGMGYIERVLAMPQGGVMTTNGGEFEYHAAPGVMEDVVHVNAGPGFVAGGVALGAGGKFVVAGVSMSFSASGPTTYGGAPGAYRLADPGVTASDKTFVIWATPTVWNGTVTLTANVIPVLGPAGITEGTITFREGSTVLGTVRAGALAPAPWTTPGPYPIPVVDVPAGVTLTLAPGDHTITAEYSGTARWAASRSTTTFNVPQTIAVQADLAVSNANPAVGEGIFLTATLTPVGGGTPPATGLVTFYDGDQVLNNVQVVDGVAILATDSLAAGPHSLRAVYVAMMGYSGAESAPVTVTVAAPKVTTETTLTATAPAAVVGAPFTLTARVRGAGGAAVAGGTVTFTDGSTVLGTAPVGAGGVATLTTALRLGTRTLRAAYSGDTGALASNAQAISVTVGKALTATSLVAPTRTFTPGQVVELTASVRITAGSAFPVGTVEFREGTRVLGTAQIDGRGQARLTVALTAGAHAFTAVYLGCSTCEGSASAAVTLSSGRATTTTALAVAVPAPVFGQPQTLTARVTGATSGRVDFFDGQVFIGSASLNAAGVASLTFGSNLGAHRYRAVFAGTDLADTSASGWTSLTVAKALPTVSITVGSDGAIRATVRAPYGGSPIGTVTFKANGVVLGTASVNGNGIATFSFVGRLAPGTHRITAVYGGSSCFLGNTSDPLDLTIG